MCAIKCHRITHKPNAKPNHIDDTHTHTKMGACCSVARDMKATWDAIAEMNKEQTKLDKNRPPPNDFSSAFHPKIAVPTTKASAYRPTHDCAAPQKQAATVIQKIYRWDDKEHIDLVGFFISKGANDWNWEMRHAAERGHMGIVRRVLCFPRRKCLELEHAPEATWTL